ncbi:hypothetical protein [Thermobifida halotolerans]|uniref:hypothetical protein n=1 Tax=Thermobifida halotolerans TaxID=483545 RepID=UPI000838972A|nr:hypothetical protein [Thermobifida halotolerans]
MEKHDAGPAAVLGPDRLILPFHNVEQTVTAPANLGSVLGAALSAAAPWQHRTTDPADGEASR